MASMLSNLSGTCGCGPIVGHESKRRRKSKSIRIPDEWIPSFREDEFTSE